MRVFVCILECGSLSAATRALGLTQLAASNHLHAAVEGVVAAGAGMGVVPTRARRRFGGQPGPRVVALREGRVAFDGHPKRLTEDELAKIYAVGPCRTESGENPELPYARHGIEVSIRITEGRDDVSSH